jgi:SHS2 domain-containing protein
MNYRYLEDAAPADIAFEAWGRSLEEMFTAAADATMNAMIDNPSAVRMEEDVRVRMADPELELLLFRFLNEFLFYKDSRRLLLRVKDISIRADDAVYKLDALLSGERLDPERHQPVVDVKAITMHKFGIELADEGWKATVVLDI